ncbi:hypothetical protein CBS101457_001571 [Exobasidium rhododendri]|nr:hypothetical protein CBS101457_001571 [Exobasidium rhododendri]
MQRSLIGLTPKSHVARIFLHSPWQRRASSLSQSSSSSESNLNGNNGHEAEEQTSNGGTLPHKVISSIKGDAFLHMLASPLRRCTVTQTVLPKALMFQMTSHRGPAGNELQQELIASQVEKIQREPNSLLRRNSRRWIRRVAKRSKHKSLLQSQRMLLHKIVTSQTDQSRERFQSQLKDAKNQITSLLHPPPKGQLLPFGITRESGSKDHARGKGVWCSLSKKIVAEVANKLPHRTVITTNPAPRDLVKLVGEDLELRVLEEICLLQRKLATTPTVETMESGWLIRRLRGPEVRSVLHHGSIQLHYGANDSSLACLIVSNGDARLKKDAAQPPLYRLDKLIALEERQEIFKDAMREIAILLRKKAVRKHKRVALEQTIKSTNSNPTNSTDGTDLQETPPSIAGQKYPRLHVIKRDERTVDLSMALWRLHSWCESG